MIDAQARSVIAVCGVLGFLVAGGAGLATNNVMLALVLGLIGALIGIGIGRIRAFSLRLQAQTALCQAQIEENTAAGRILLESRARHAAG